MGTVGTRQLVTVRLRCGHTFTAEITAHAGDLVWCADCGHYRPVTKGARPYPAPISWARCPYCLRERRASRADGEYLLVDHNRWNGTRMTPCPGAGLPGPFVPASADKLEAVGERAPRAAQSPWSRGVPTSQPPAMAARSESRSLARYDSPGFPDRLPGFPPQNSHDYMTAPGSEGINPSDTAGGTVGTPEVSALFVTSQEPTPRVSVTAGDTSSMSDDLAVHPDIGGVRVPGDPAVTGAGQGHAGHNPHPNSSGVNHD